MWGRRLFTKRNGIFALLLFHFALIVGLNLPNNSVRDKLEPHFRGYLNLTGLNQHGWRMFGPVHYEYRHFELAIPNKPGKPDYYSHRPILDSREYGMVDSFSRSSEPYREAQIYFYLQYKRDELGLGSDSYLRLLKYSATAQHGQRPKKKVLSFEWEMEPDQP